MPVEGVAGAIGLVAVVALEAFNSCFRAVGLVEMRPEGSRGFELVVAELAPHRRKSQVNILHVDLELGLLVELLGALLALVRPQLQVNHFEMLVSAA